VDVVTDVDILYVSENNPANKRIALRNRFNSSDALVYRTCIKSGCNLACSFHSTVS